MLASADDRFDDVRAPPRYDDFHIPDEISVTVHDRRISSVKRDQLAREGQQLSPADEQALRQPILDKYEQEGSPYYSTARVWDDGILDPVDTRQALALGLSTACNAPIPDPRFGVFRM